LTDAHERSIGLRGKHMNSPHQRECSKHLALLLVSMSAGGIG
jgi:hypothetical protein